ncbi:hypothetical protein SAMN05192552_101468 [Natrinema hispanicum]|uniref:Uncharacterized protein n=1 Tax=Natrinema hispanicum TaxID=392421 RepID=A0A1G6SL45_9EURY|nr:hypothetical protein SAMN05192552_101468 [Natrinema hispanicum]
MKENNYERFNLRTETAELYEQICRERFGTTKIAKTDAMHAILSDLVEDENE